MVLEPKQFHQICQKSQANVSFYSIKLWQNLTARRGVIFHQKVIYASLLSRRHCLSPSHHAMFHNPNCFTYDKGKDQNDVASIAIYQYGISGDMSLANCDISREDQLRSNVARVIWPNEMGVHMLHLLCVRSLLAQ